MFINKIFNNSKKLMMLLAAILISTTSVWADAPQPDTLKNPLALVLVIIICSLVIAIAIMANVVNGAASIYREKLKKEKSDSQQILKTIISLVILCGACVSSTIAQTASNTVTQPQISESINALSPTIFYLLVSIIGVEVLVLIVLSYQLRILLGIEKARISEAKVERPSWSRIWWDKLNAAISIEREHEIDLKHDYDGIRELDNRLPPWWTWTFVFTIIFGIGYLWRYHVAQSAPLQAEEYSIAVQKAEIEQEEYLKQKGNKVDENTVVMLDADGIAAGKALFSQNCVACHGPEAQGAQVGPNLTDDYWLHGGRINDIFKTIKYGWVEKGMKSWKEDFSPAQIAQLASYLKSLKGSKPANPKEPQGELFIENKAGSDSTKIGTDSLSKPSK